MWQLQPKCPRNHTEKILLRRTHVHAHAPRLGPVWRLTHWDLVMQYGIIEHGQLWCNGLLPVSTHNTPHSSSSRVSYGVSIVRNLEDFDRGITASHCTFSKHKNIWVFSDIEMAQVVEIFPHKRLDTVDPKQQIQWLLITWRFKDPGHQQPVYRSSYHGIFQFPHQKGYVYNLFQNMILYVNSLRPSDAYMRQ